MPEACFRIAFIFTQGKAFPFEEDRLAAWSRQALRWSGGHIRHCQMLVIKSSHVTQMNPPREASVVQIRFRVKLKSSLE